MDVRDDGHGGWSIVIDEAQPQVGLPTWNRKLRFSGNSVAVRDGLVTVMVLNSDDEIIGGLWIPADELVKAGRLIENKNGKTQT